MTENGYYRSFVMDNRGSKNENRDSGYYDEEEEIESEKKEKLVVNNTKNINSFNISVSTEDQQKEKNMTSNCCLNLNEIICIINMLASTLGGGAFVFPYILYQVGILTSLILFIFITVSVYYTLDLLRRFVVDSKLISFSIITQTTLGNFWLKVYIVTAFLFYMSCIVNYLDILYKFFTSFTEILKDGWPKLVYFLISCIIEIILCLFTNKLSSLHFLSLIVVSSYFIIILVLLIKSIIFFNNEKFKNLSLFTIEDKNSSSNTGWSVFLFIMSKAIEFFYGYIYHSCFPTLLSGLKNINNNSSRKVQNISFSLLAIIYIMILFFGYSFYDNNSEYIFENNIDIENEFLKNSFKCILILLFITLVPIRYVVIRDNYTTLVGKEELPLIYEIPITSICLIINNSIIYLTGNSNNFISTLIHYFGGAFGVFICFVLPVISHISINRKTNLRAIFGYIIMAIFIVIGIFSIFYNFQAKDDGITN